MLAIKWRTCMGVMSHTLSYIRVERAHHAWAWPVWGTHTSYRAHHAWACLGDPSGERVHLCTHMLGWPLCHVSRAYLSKVLFTYGRMPKYP